MLNLDSDTLWRSAIRRQVGFDFYVRQTKRKIYVGDEMGNRVGVNVPQGIVDENVIARLVNACLKLKKLHESTLDTNQS